MYFLFQLMITPPHRIWFERINSYLKTHIIRYGRREMTKSWNILYIYCQQEKSMTITNIVWIKVNYGPFQFGSMNVTYEIFYNILCRPSQPQLKGLGQILKSPFSLYSDKLSIYSEYLMNQPQMIFFLQILTKTY